MQAPSFPQNGKGGKAFLSFNDGVQVSSFPMTLQPSYSYSGSTYIDKMYLLGGGKMINARPGISTSITVDGIIDGLDISPTLNDDEIAVSSGTIQVAGVAVPVAADTAVDITRPASGQMAWVAISVAKNDGAISATKGTDAAALVATFGAGAGAKPFIPVTDLLLGYLAIGSTVAPITYAEISLADREFCNISFTLYASIGAVMVSTPLKKCHAGSLSRTVQFSGKYYDDDLLSEVGNCTTWSITPSTSTITAVTLGEPVSSTDITGWSFTFGMLFTSSLALDAIYNRNGFAAIRLQLASGEFFRFVGTLSGGIKNDSGSYVAMDVSGSINGRPYYSGQ